jgi:hypothetical protein
MVFTLRTASTDALSLSKEMTMEALASVEIALKVFSDDVLARHDRSAPEEVLSRKRGFCSAEYELIRDYAGKATIVERDQS